MKLLCMLLLFVSTSSFAKGDSLYSSTFCAHSNILCVQQVGIDFLTDQNGRCGCVSDTDYYSMDFCSRAYIVCDQANGYTFSTLMKKSQEEAVGCGCFKTEN